MFVKVIVPYTTLDGKDERLVFTEHFDGEVFVEDPIVEVMIETFGVRTCKDCGSPFTVSQEEDKWLREHKLKPYKRCKECRAVRKERNREADSDE